MTETERAQLYGKVIGAGLWIIASVVVAATVCFFLDIALTTLEILYR